MPRRLELGSSTGAVQLCGYDDPTALISRFEAVQSVAAIDFIYGDLSPFPYHLLSQLSPTV